MKIGSLELGHKQILAPMADVTDAPFRKIAKKNGAGLTFTQMVSAKGILENNFETLRHLAFDKSEKPIGVQILGNDPSLVGSAVREIANYKPDIIDLNCGCPVDNVTKYKMGAQILDNPKLLGRLMRSMKDNSSGIPVSVKIRLGKDLENINVSEICRIAEDNGADLVTIHARTRIGRYSEYPSYNYLSKVKKEINIPVIGNGSAFEPQCIHRIISETGCDAVMIARGALGNPFIFSSYNTFIDTGEMPGKPDVETVLETALEHLLHLKNEYGEFEALNKAKKNIIWYFRKYEGVNALLSGIFEIKEYDYLEEFVKNHADNILNGDYSGDNINLIDEKFKHRVVFWISEDKRRLKQVTEKI